jgi:pimeloyl-ACP methyl ester carboxylesterase
MIDITSPQGISIDYFLSGEENKSTILFVHGLGANLDQFKYQHEFFKDKFQVLSISLRGHGKTISHSGFTATDFILKNLSDDIIFLLDTIGIEKIHFVGNSMGGNIGYELLRAHSNRFLSFTTFGTSAFMNKPKVLVSILKLLYKLLSPKTIANMAQSVCTTIDSKKIVYNMYLHTSKQTILYILPYLASFNYLETIKNNQIPTLIIKGEYDKEVNKLLDITIQAYHEHHDFTLLELKGVGHYANLDNPNKFNQELQSFMSSI